jgi:hypothetical protein
VIRVINGDINRLVHQGSPLRRIQRPHAIWGR